MSRTEILISGYGGQGVVRLGQILGQAAVNEGLFTTMLISHGTETRGGYVRSQVVISDRFIDSPVVECPDFFCALSGVAYGRFKGLCTSESAILYDPGQVEPDDSVAARHLAVPAEAAGREQLGNELFANVIMLGALSGQLPLISTGSIVRALYERIPRFPEKNLQAFNIGWAMLADAR
ncbi:2-oxoacid:acceptor oxidoreductase family protein [Geobacter pickeringii]|uniref:2-oxoglutarate ferredoxin oxidoreductase subunit gamma n=1 Tax=Geobacter pickeringii TaxID=345632 RepID=A0A0B5BDK9_9BACT|nr:2-oxoacid:acceptor oxidoreductase family protein [Geobacter pickeringii]AJE02166.1 2-oxoglutarate ferredoxin oxidoreductase subunit gamma [Geobacter pickeringii]